MNARRSNLRAFSSDHFEISGRDNRPVGVARVIWVAVLVGVTVLISTIVMSVGLTDMCDKCGSVCWHGMQQVERNRY